jgi:hypothetical protein
MVQHYLTISVFLVEDYYILRCMSSRALSDTSLGSNSLEEIRVTHCIEFI